MVVMDAVKGAKMANKERVQLLVEALRSAEYRQIKDKLGSTNGYCCLGVACEVAIQNGLEIESRTIDGEYFYDGESCTLPNSVRRWYEFDNVNPDIYIDSEDNQIPATTANDDRGLDFQQIADGFEKQYLNDTNQ